MNFTFFLPGKLKVLTLSLVQMTLKKIYFDYFSRRSKIADGSLDKNHLDFAYDTSNYIMVIFALFHSLNSATLF